MAKKREPGGELISDIDNQAHVFRFPVLEYNSVNFP